MIYAIIFIVFAFIMSFWLPGAKDLDKLEKEESVAQNQNMQMIPRKRARIGALTFAAIVAVAALSGGYAWGKHDAVNGSAVVSDNSEASAQTSAPQNLLPASGMQLYANAQMGFSVQIPQGWTISQPSGQSSSSEVDLANGKSTDRIQEFSVSVANISDLMRSLQQQPAIQKQVFTTFDGQQAIAFSLSGNQNGIALLKDGKLFYLLGPDLSQMQNFQIQ